MAEKATDKLVQIQKLAIKEGRLGIGLLAFTLVTGLTATTLPNLEAVQYLAPWLMLVPALLSISRAKYHFKAIDNTRKILSSKEESGTPSKQIS